MTSSRLLFGLKKTLIALAELDTIITDWIWLKSSTAYELFIYKIYIEYMCMCYSIC